MNQQPDISVITINYNGYCDTCELIDSWINVVTSINYEIIVIDNGSNVNEADLLKKKYPLINVIRSDINKGFSGGNNLGIKVAKGKYLYFLNNDTIIPKDNLSLFIRRLLSSDKIGGVSPLIRDFQTPHCIQYAGYTHLSRITLRNKSIGEGKLDEKQYAAQPTPYLHGAAMLIKKEVIDRVGMMPEDYFLYYEELDWCTSMTKKGYILWYDPACEIWHKESTSIGKENPLKLYYISRNRLLYIDRNRQGWTKILAILYQMTIACPKNVLTYYMKGENEKAKSYLKGTKAFFKFKNIGL